MVALIILLGILIILIGTLCLLFPKKVFNWMQGNLDKTGFYVMAIATRLAFGILFVLTAQESKFPGFILVFGGLALVAAVFFILIGHQGFRKLMSSLLSNFEPYAFVAGLIAMAAGGFIIFAFVK